MDEPSRSESPGRKSRAQVTLGWGVAAFAGSVVLSILASLGLSMLERRMPSDMHLGVTPVQPLVHFFFCPRRPSIAAAERPEALVTVPPIRSRTTC